MFEIQAIDLLDEDKGFLLSTRILPWLKYLQSMNFVFF